jgi:hypothetical protein
MENEKQKMKVRIPSKFGYIELEGNLEQVVQAIKRIEDEQKNSRINKRSSRSIADLIFELINEGFFNQPKKLSEIKEGIEKKGFKYSVTSIYPILLRNFIREGIIKFNGKPKSHKYYV